MPPSTRDRLLFHLGVAVVRGTVVGVVGLVAGFLTWLGLVMDVNPVTSAAIAGCCCATLAMVAGSMAERHLPHLRRDRK